MDKYFALLSIVLLTIVFTFTSAVRAENEFSYFPEINSPDHLLTINEDNMNSDEFLLLSSLQGILAQEKPKIYITGNKSYDYWLSKMKNDYDVSTEKMSDVFEILENFKEQIPGYILTEKGEGLNVATSLAGIKEAVLVTPELEDEVKELGLVQVIDARDYDLKWVFEEYKDEFNNSLIFTQDPSKIELRDYMIATRSFVFFAEDDDFYEQVYSWVEDDAPRLGWGAEDENVHVGRAGENGLFTLPADWAKNMSALAGIKVHNLEQDPDLELSETQKEAGSQTDQQVHYVAFVMSDGDNVQWVLGNKAHNPDYYASEYRGEFPMNWGIPPTLIDLAPAGMEWYYENSRQDYFVAGPSGGGYMYPSENPDFEKHAERLNEYFGRSDLSYSIVIDWPDIGDEDFQEVASVYAAQPNIEGILYYNYSPYDKGDGKIVWENGKPFIAARENLWEGNPERMARKINSYSDNPEEPEAYTIVNVHAWSHNVEDVAEVVNNLDSHVQVVNIDEFFKQVKKNLQD